MPLAQSTPDSWTWTVVQAENVPLPFAAGPTPLSTGRCRAISGVKHWRPDKLEYRNIDILDNRNIVGSAVAGNEIEPSIPVLEEIRMGAATDDQVEVTGDLLGRHASHIDRLYALRVKGQSMIDALINDGDLVIMEPQETAENGQTVAVWLKAEQEATLKRFYLEEGRVRLQPVTVIYPPRSGSR